MPKSQAIITDAARICFFQYGYQATNVSLVSKYSEVSRATMYKHFSSKEDLFRAVVLSHFDEIRPILNDYLQGAGDFWDDTQALIESRCMGVFDEIPNLLIRAELIQTGQKLCIEMIDAERDTVRSAIAKRLNLAIEQNDLSLVNTGLSLEKFAQVVESVPSNIAFSNVEDNNMSLILDTFTLFRSATKLNSG